MKKVQENECHIRCKTAFLWEIEAPGVKLGNVQDSTSLDEDGEYRIFGGCPAVCTTVREQQNLRVILGTILLG